MGVRGRLTDVWQDGEHLSAYSYDGNGNRIAHARPANGTGIGATDVVYDDQDRLLRYGEMLYTYTANGELATRSAGGETVSYAYDVLGNLQAVALADGPLIEYVVDGLYRRLGKKIDGLAVQGFLYRDGLNPIAELSSDNSVISVFVYATRSNVPDFIVSRKENGNMWATYRIIADHLGSPRLVLESETGRVAQRLRYDEFGNVIEDSNPGFQPFGFTGGIYDHHTGLVRFGMRDYDPQTGRWTAKDPIGFGGGDANLYRYVSADPVNSTDATGLAELKYDGRIPCEDPRLEDECKKPPREFRVI